MMRLRSSRLRTSLRRRTQFAKIWLNLVLVRIRLSILGYPYFEKSPTKLSQRKANVDPKRFAAKVQRAAKFVPGALCLAQAIAAQRGLARLGHETVIRIGVKSDEHTNLVAHAWLLYRDSVILGGSDSELKEYQTMTDITSAIVG